MAKVRTPKTVKAAPVAAKKSAAAPKAKKVRAVAQKAETKTIFSKPVEGMKTMQDTFKKTAAEAAEKATAFGKDVVEFHKGNFAAVVESGKAAAKGTQTAAQEAVALTKQNWEAATTHAKAVAAVKTPTDFFQLQSEFARKQFDGAVALFSKNSEFGLKLAGEIVAPLQNRYAVVAEQLKGRMAA